MNRSRLAAALLPPLAALALALAPPGESAQAQAAAAPQSGDLLCLKDGRILEGRPMERVAGGILVKFMNGDVRVPDALVLDALLEDEAAAAEPKKAAELQKRRDERRRYVDELKSLAEWRNRRKETTRHFEFEYTVPPHVFAGYRDSMEAYFTEFAKLWNTKQPKDGRLKVCFYGDAGTFHQVAGVGGGVLGYFRFVDPMELDIYFDRLDPELTEDVMFHEANHYLQKLLNPDVKMPHFPGEALAEYYGASAWNPQTKRLTVGLIQDERLAEVKHDQDSGKKVPLEELLSTANMYEHYTWGWTLVHYLMNQPRYAKKFQRFVVGLVNGADVERQQTGLQGLSELKDGEVLRTFMKQLDLKGKEGLKKLEDEWYAYITTELKAVTARGFEKAGLKVARSYPPRPIKAKNLLRKSLDAGSKSADVRDKLAGILASEDGAFPEAIALWREAIEIEPLTARYYSNLAHALEKSGKKEEGKRLLALAKELDPDDPWLDLDLRGS